MGILRYFLSMEVARSKQGIIISKKKYVLDLHKGIGMTCCKLIGIPLILIKNYDIILMEVLLIKGNIRGW